MSAVENQLGFPFPHDYRAFITTFGTGDTNNSIRVFSPRKIQERFLYETRERLSEHWFWNDNSTSLTQSRAVECVPFFDSAAGDDILFHPSDQNHWFILPHEEEDIIVVRSFRELCNVYAHRCADDDGNPMQPPFEFSRYE